VRANLKLDELVREAARRMLAAAWAEVAAYIETHKG
jgi:hypothetical protein